MQALDHDGIENQTESFYNNIRKQNLILPLTLHGKSMLFLFVLIKHIHCKQHTTCPGVDNEHTVIVNTFALNRHHVSSTFGTHTTLPGEFSCKLTVPCTKFTTEFLIN